MRKKMMLGLWRYMINVPPFMWEKQISKMKRKLEKEYGSLSGEHRSVHHFVVRELAEWAVRCLPSGSQTDWTYLPTGW